MRKAKIKISCHYLQRALDGIQNIHWYFMQLIVYPYSIGILFLDLLSRTHDWRPSGMETHREQDTITKHPPVSCNYIAYGKRPGMTCMEVAVQVRIRDCDEELFPASGSASYIFESFHLHCHFSSISCGLYLSFILQFALPDSKKL